MRSAWVASFLAAVLVAAGCAQEDDAHRLRSLDVTASPARGGRGRGPCGLDAAHPRRLPRPLARPPRARGGHARAAGEGRPRPLPRGRQRRLRPRSAPRGHPDVRLAGRGHGDRPRLIGRGRHRPPPQHRGPAAHRGPRLLCRGRLPGRGRVRARRRTGRRGGRDRVRRADPLRRLRQHHGGVADVVPDHGREGAREHVPRHGRRTGRTGVDQLQLPVPDSARTTATSPSTSCRSWSSASPKPSPKRPRM